MKYFSTLLERRMHKSRVNITKNKFNGVSVSNASSEVANLNTGASGGD